MTHTQAAQLGWTKTFKLTVDGKSVRSVTWYSGWVSLATDGKNYQIESAVFERFVSQQWDPQQSWYYVSR